MTKQEIKEIEKIEGKPISKVDYLDIPTYIRERDEKEGDGEFDPETEEKLKEALRGDKEAGVVDNIEKTTGETIEDMGIEDEVENDCSEDYPIGGSIEPYDIERDKELIDE